MAGTESGGGNDRDDLGESDGSIECHIDAAVPKLMSYSSGPERPPRSHRLTVPATLNGKTIKIVPTAMVVMS